jgi:hypothetical protein
VELLRECGFVQLTSFFSRDFLRLILADFETFKNVDPNANLFKYPVQGVGRSEYILPFQEPFNTSQVYRDERMMNVLFEFFQSRFKMELQTIITSHAGSKDQRWHQGFQFLFHPEEQLPPFAVVVGVPLVDVPIRRGPTMLCPRRKLRFYQGYNCDHDFVNFESELGDVLIFDYKLLHKGPSNRDPEVARPMMSLVYSKLFFLNQEAIVCFFFLSFFFFSFNCFSCCRLTERLL